MNTSNRKYFIFLILVLLLSIPFYLWGAYFLVEGLPFGMPISFLMVFVPFLLSLVYSWKKNGREEISYSFKRILDFRKAEP